MTEKLQLRPGGLRHRVRQVMFRLALVVGSTLLTVIAAELGMRLIENRVRSSSLSMAPTPSERSSRGDEIVLLGVGGSCMVGEPYDPMIDPMKLLARDLRQAYPQRQFMTQLAAAKGASLSRLYSHVLDAISQQPSLFVFYAGNNEFLGEFSHSQVCHQKRSRLYDLLGWSSLFRIVFQQLQRSDISSLPTVANRQLFDGPIACRAQWQDVLLRYRLIASSFAARCRELGIPAIFISPAGNEAGYNPNRSSIQRTENEASILRLYARGRVALQQGRAEEARQAFDSILAIDSGFAEAWFRLGQSELALGDVKAARESFREAVDHDKFPWRPLEAQHRDLQSVASSHDAPYIDARVVLETASSTGLLDDSVFHDMHHPRLHGYQALARAILRRIVEDDLLGLGPAKLPAHESPERIKAVFGFAEEQQLELLESRVGWIFGACHVTFEPVDRLEKALVYLAELREIGETEFNGQPIEDVERGTRLHIEERHRHWREMAPQPAVDVPSEQHQ